MPQYLKPDEIHQIDPANPGLIIYPTDTLFALGCLATDKASCSQIYSIKKREPYQPLLVLADSIQMVLAFGAIIEPKIRELLEKIWPAPLTVVLPMEESLDISHLNRNGSKLAFRVPASQSTLNLLRHIGQPLVGTSANITRQQPSLVSSDIPNEINKHCRYIIGGELSSEGIPSTVAEFVGGNPQLIRPGAFSFDELKKTYADL